MSLKNIVFFADRLPPLIGGMEMHADYFIKHFSGHLEFPLVSIITKDSQGRDCLKSKEGRTLVDIEKLLRQLEPQIVFFNSGRWIEELGEIRRWLPMAAFFYRTGGNEILKAPTHGEIPSHTLRQSFWSKQINHSINQMITNSNYTENRLREVGITCPFARCVGGVNTLALKPSKSQSKNHITVFCAARFVPYKNHALLLTVVHKLVLRGYHFRVKLAGDGPLLEQAQKQVIRDNLGSVVEFMGVLSNNEVCHEIAQADIYMQLSEDLVTEVPGGSYIHSEGMGRSILEALAAGTFVVAGRSGALPEIVTQDRGLLVELDNVEVITDKISILLNKPPQRLPFSEHYSWGNLFNRYEILFRAS